MKKNIQILKDIIRFLIELKVLIKCYKIEDITFSIFNLKLIDISGHEYIVFQYEDKIIKIHRNHLVAIDNLNEQNIISFIGIPTQRILMPTYPIYDTKDKIAGYAMPVISGETDISSISMDHFLNEAHIIDRDKDLLSQKLILLKDIRKGNTIYNGKLFIVDSGRYININVMSSCLNPDISDLFKMEDIDTIRNYIYRNNNSQINRFLYEYVMGTVLNEYDSSMCLYKISQYFQYLSKELSVYNYIDLIEQISNRNMTIKEFATQLKQKVYL